MEERQPGDIISPGGAAGSMCEISPGDLVGTIGNLITRIEKLETALSQVLGANLHAQQLSDISSQVGWVYGVDYMGIPGWIMTEAGSLIPPAGFTFLGSGLTLSDGNTYNAVLMDSDGVLQYGFGTDGSISGSSAYQSDYAIWSAGSASGGTGANPDQFYLNGITETVNTLSTAQTVLPTAQEVTWIVRKSGLYLLTVGGTSRIFNTTGAPEALFTIGVSAAGPGSLTLIHDISFYKQTLDSVNRAIGTNCWPIRLNANDTVQVSITPSSAGGGTVGNYQLTNIYVSLIWEAPVGG